MRVESPSALRAFRDAAKLGGVDRFEDLMLKSICFASTGDYASEVVARKQDAAAVLAMPDRIAIEHRGRERPITTWASERMFLVEEDDALSFRLRKVERLAIVAAKVIAIGQRF
jgi:hypothetical protein